MTDAPNTETKPTTPAVPAKIPAKAIAVSRGGGLQLQTFDDMYRFASLIATSDAVPKSYQGKPANIVVAVQKGFELGLEPMQSLVSIMVVNGIPTMYGDSMLGLLRSKGAMDPKFGNEGIIESHEGTGENMVYHCETKRKNSLTTLKTSFSWKDAVAAGLVSAKDLYKKYPQRMLMFRARGFNLRDNFSDVLMGIKTWEEVQDYQILDEETGEFEKPVPRAKFDSNINVPKAEPEKPEPVDAEFAEAPEPEPEVNEATGEIAEVEPQEQSVPTNTAPVTETEKKEPAKPKAKAAKQAPLDPKVEEEMKGLPFFQK